MHTQVSTCWHSMACTHSQLGHLQPRVLWGTCQPCLSLTSRHLHVALSNGQQCTCTGAAITLKRSMPGSPVLLFALLASHRHTWKPLLTKGPAAALLSLDAIW